MRNCFGPLKLKANGRDVESFVYVKLNERDREIEIISVDDEKGQKISSNQMTQVKSGVDRVRECECVKIHCFRSILFLKFYPISERDLLWFPELVDTLLSLKKTHREVYEDGERCDRERKLGFSVYLDRLMREYGRILSNTLSKWRFSSLNTDYALCSTYSQVLLVPDSISDTVLLHAAKFRVKNRFPLLSYIFKGRALMRSGQPLVGLTQRRSVQDEKLIEAMKMCSGGTDGESESESLVIVDARPSKSVMANTVIGAGIERLDCYNGSERIYLNIENIHTIRESHDHLSYQIKSISRSIQGNNNALWIEVEERCDWLDYIRIILEGVKRVVEAIFVERKHILIHCSDGWDRTAQLISLTQLCLDPFYRSKRGFRVLIEKDWLSTGHRFADRANTTSKMQTSTSGGNSNPTNPWDAFKNNFYSTNSINNGATIDEEECPIFLQFIEVVVQLCRQYPLHFPELSDEFLLEIVDEVMRGSAVFFGNCEKDRQNKMPMSETETTNYETGSGVETDDTCHGDTETMSRVIVPKVERSKMILWPAFYKRYF